jgi:multiple sugar transport system substrate-binding protein
MPTINITLAVAHDPQWMNFIQKAIEPFGRELNASVKMEAFGWDDIWKKLVDISVRKSDTDVSEVGSTWVASLVSMNSLRPFQPADIGRIGNKENFHPAVWRSASVLGSDQVWSIPYAADVRVVYYWRDMLEQAGIDESNAFSTPEAMQQTLERLQTVTPTPLVLQLNNREIVYSAASWLWAEGSDFVSVDGKSTLLNETKARQALQKYFQLARFLPGKELSSSLTAYHNMFFGRQAAVTIAGPGFVPELWSHQGMPPWSSQLGISSMPGPSFVGGTNLVIWEHSVHDREAVRLIAYLISPEVQNALVYFTTGLPTTQAAMNALVKSKAYTQEFINSIETGRSLPSIPLWGLTEQRLADTFCRIWQELCEAPSTNIPEILSQRLPALARRLDTILAG